MEPGQIANYSALWAVNPKFKKYSQIGSISVLYILVTSIAAFFSLLLNLIYFTDYCAAVFWSFLFGHFETGLVLAGDIVASILPAVLMALVIIMLLAKRRSFLTVLCFSVVIDLLIIILRVILSARYPIYGLDDPLSTSIIRVVCNVLIVVYFATSTRVRTYMGNDTYLTKGLLTRWIKPPQPVEPYLAVPANPPAGWYPDPAVPGRFLWWDGRQWQVDNRALIR